MSTLLITHPSFVEHDTGPGHPERADRLRAVAKVLEHELFRPLVRHEAPMADEAVLLLGHPAEYIAELEEARLDAGGHSVRLDPDTVLSPGSWEPALRAVGAKKSTMSPTTSSNEVGRPSRSRNRANRRKSFDNSANRWHSF